VTSEVFLAAFARIGDFTGGGDAFRRFIFTLAHHKAVDEIRRQHGPRVPRQVELVQEAHARRSPSAEDVALREEYGPRVAGWLAALPLSQREVLLLRIAADLDLGEVAEHVGRTEGAVKQLQYRALRTLRAQVPTPRSGAGPKPADAVVKAADNVEAQGTLAVRTVGVVHPGRPRHPAAPAPRQ
jgi:RNA polymerase sigma-70 factor (ECF subfamily)